MSENQLPERVYPVAYAAKPGKVQAIAIMCLVDGILNVLYSLSLTCGAVISIIGILALPFTLYPGVLGVMEIVYAAQLLSDPPRVKKPAKYLAVMQICNIIVGDVISLVIGILSLFFYDDYEVRDYFGRITLG
jgi:hypothetical protein